MECKVVSYNKATCSDLAARSVTFHNVVRKLELTLLEYLDRYLFAIHWGGCRKGLLACINTNRHLLNLFIMPLLSKNIKCYDKKFIIFFS